MPETASIPSERRAFRAAALLAAFLCGVVLTPLCAQEEPYASRLQKPEGGEEFRSHAEKVLRNLRPEEKEVFQRILGISPNRRSALVTLVPIGENVLRLRDLQGRKRSLRREDYLAEQEKLFRGIDEALRGAPPWLLQPIAGSLGGMLADAGYALHDRMPRPGPGVVMDLKSPPPPANFERPRYAEYAQRPPRELLSQPILSAAAVPQPPLIVVAERSPQAEPERRAEGPGPLILLLLLVLGTPALLLFLLRKRLAAWVVRQGLVAAGTPLPPSGTPQPAASVAVLEREPGGLPRIPTGYRIVRRIGVGGMGEVYEAEDVSLQRRVAVKRMRGEIQQDPREVERFLSEARVVAKLRHPSIIEIYAIVELDGEVYLVFEYIDGMTLEQALGKHQRLTLPQIRAFLRPVCAALAYAHEHGVIHRDLKPSNIMITRESVVKVMDFGIARVGKEAMSRLSMTNTVAGTPPYMAPEAETGVVRRESDLYSLGVCLYELLTGARPFEGTGAGMLMNKMNGRFEPPSRRVQGLPAGLDAFFAAVLSPDPDKRPRTAAEFLAAFEAAAGLALT